MSHAGCRNTVIYSGLPWDIPWCLITSYCLKFSAVPESLAAPFCLGESSGRERLEVNGMGGGEGKRARSDEAEGKIN